MACWGWVVRVCRSEHVPDCMGDRASCAAVARLRWALPCWRPHCLHGLMMAAVAASAGTCVLMLCDALRCGAITRMQQQPALLPRQQAAAQRVPAPIALIDLRLRVLLQ